VSLPLSPSWCTHQRFNSITSRQVLEHGSTASSSGPDWTISAAIFSAQLMQTPARSIPQPVQLQLDLRDVGPRLSLTTPPSKRYPRLAAVRARSQPQSDYSLHQMGCRKMHRTPHHNMCLTGSQPMPKTGLQVEAH
jgi:hypothetical protein